ncbi:MAG: hypothetical protein AMXMBFR83_25190 [Phycisphaerae bacterium]
MDTARQATGDKRQATNGRLPTTATTATGDNRPAWYTRPEAAAVLGLSVSALRRLQTQLGVPGEVVPAERGGTVCRLSAADLERLSASDKRGRRQARQPAACRLSASDNRDRRQPPPGGDAGWREALALATAEADRLRSQLEAERVARQEAVRRAEEAERGYGAAVARLDALRAAWWRWYALARRPWWRLRRLPDPPPELAADRLLTAGERPGVY